MYVFCQDKKDLENHRLGHKAVVLVDEYDKPMLDVLGTEQEQINRETLKGFLTDKKSQISSVSNKMIV